MSSDKNRISIRLGDLRSKVDKHCLKQGTTPALFIRQLIADHFGIEAPELRVGNPNFGKPEGKKGKVTIKRTRPVRSVH